nr:sugar ABC transporter ATP-binding protein [Feifania hominis]
MRGISKAFQGVQALKNCDFSLKPGEACCLCGENGSGKSTLIKVLTGVYTADEGTITINGETFTELSPMQAIDKGIQVIFQDFALFPNLTVAENITLNNSIRAKKKFVNWKQIYKDAQAVIDNLNVQLDLKEIVENLPVAQKQLVAICRALAQDAKVVIMDEPTTALTQKEVESLYKIIEDLKKRGIALIFVSHKLDEVFEVSEKICIIRDGQNVCEGPVSEFDKSKVTYYMTGREIESHSFEGEAKNDTPILSVRNLTRPGKFEDVSFDLYDGEILGITGLLGSGRTEVAKAIFGVAPAKSGEIYLDGKLAHIKKPSDGIKNRIAYVPEDRLTEGLFLRTEIGTNIIAAIISQLKKHKIFIDGKKKDKIIDDGIKNLSIKLGSPDNPVSSLSGGNQQKVLMAKWLATNPRYLLLNGPTVGVDVGAKSDIHEIIRNLGRAGIGVIVISDDLPEILQTTSRIIIMNQGRVVTSVKTADVTEKDLQALLVKA